jgi:hypothetical protein
VCTIQPGSALPSLSAGGTSEFSAVFTSTLIVNNSYLPLILRGG